MSTVIESCWGHRVDDPPVPDLSEWQRMLCGRPTDLFYDRGTAHEPYTYFMHKQEDGTYSWNIVDGDTEWGQEGFATAEEALADLREFHEVMTRGK